LPSKVYNSSYGQLICIHTYLPLLPKKDVWGHTNSTLLSCNCQNNCHGPCLVTFFPKNNHWTAPAESLMMATSSLFSATLTTSHLRRTYIGPLSEFFLYSDTTKKSLFLSFPLPTSTMRYLPQHNQSPPCSTHIPCHRPIILCIHQFSRSWVSVATRTCKDLSQHPSTSFRVQVFLLYVPFCNYMLS